MYIHVYQKIKKKTSLFLEKFGNPEISGNVASLTVQSAEYWCFYGTSIDIEDYPSYLVDHLLSILASLPKDELLCLHPYGKTYILCDFSLINYSMLRVLFKKDRIIHVCRIMQ